MMKFSNYEVVASILSRFEYDEKAKSSAGTVSSNCIASQTGSWLTNCKRANGHARIMVIVGILEVMQSVQIGRLSNVKWTKHIN